MASPLRIILFALCGLAISAPTHAQPKIPSSQIPSNLIREKYESFRKLYSANPLIRAHGASELYATPEAIPFLVSMLDDNVKYTEVIKTPGGKGAVGSEVSRTTTDTPLGRTTTVVTQYSGYEELPMIYVFTGMMPSGDAANALGKLGRPAVEPVLKALEAKPERFLAVCKAIYALPRDDEACLPPFVARLKSDQAVVRWAAAIGVHYYLNFVNIQQMIVPLMKDQSAFVRQEAAAALGSALDSVRSKKAAKNVDLIPVLAEALNDKAPPVRLEALRSLQYARTNKVTAEVAKLVSDPDVKVRVQAVGTLQSTKDPEAVPALVEAAADKKVEVRKAAIQVLSEFDDPRAVDCILAAVKDKEISVREAAAQMRKIPNDDAAKALVGMLADKATNVRILANNTILHHANPITVPHLVALAKTSKDVQARGNAFRVLQYLAKRNVAEAKAAVQNLQMGK